MINMAYMVVIHSVESIEELSKNLLFGLAASLNLRVEFSVVNTNQVINSEFSRSIPIDLLECLKNEIFSELVHLSSDSIDELIEVDVAVSVAVEVIKKLLNFVIFEASAEISESVLKFFRVKLSVSVVIGDL